ncbi:MAG TPA: hypothetical protein VGK93_03295 [Candidatus Eisenbacteria bacterium]
MGRSIGARLLRLAPLLVVGAAWLAYLLLTNVQAIDFAGPAYETSFGAHIVRTLLSYAQWSVDLSAPARDSASLGSHSPRPLGLLVHAILGLGAFLTRQRTELSSFGLTWWVLGLLPVLPLVRQQNLHYLYAPSVGWPWRSAQ